jgi:hypothetical protein
VHHVAESAHTGKDQLVGPKYVFRTGRNFHLLAQSFDGIDNAPDITGTII